MRRTGNPVGRLRWVQYGFGGISPEGPDSTQISMKVSPSSFKNQLALMFGGFALFIGLPTYFYIDYVHAQQLVRDRGQALHDLAGAVATVISENLGERKREVELLAQTPTFRRGALDGADARGGIERLQASYPYYSWIGLVDGEGVVHVATGGLLENQSVAQRPWFKNGLGGTFLGDLHEAVLLSKLLPRLSSGAPIRFIDFAAPVLDDSGKVRGVLAAHAHWSWASDVVGAIVPDKAAEKQIEVFVVNRDNKVIYPDAASSVDVPPAAYSDAAFAFDRWGGSTTYLSAKAQVREQVPEKPLGWYVLVRQPREAALADVRALQRVVVSVSAAAVALFLLAGWWGARRMSRPLEQLAVVAKRIEQGDEHNTFEVEARSAELAKLVEALRGMASTLVSRKHSLEESNHALEHKVAERTAELLRLNAELTQLARQDALTGLPNRFATNERLQVEFSRMRRTLVPYAVMMMDIDFFKRINDTYGHAVGDEVLRHVAGVIRGSLRETDFVGRVGGEEFLVLLPCVDAGQAALVGEKVRKAVETSPLAPVGVVTTSVGIGIALPVHTSAEEAVRLADDCLYEAKREGRNRVKVGGSIPEGEVSAPEV